MRTENVSDTWNKDFVQQVCSQVTYIEYYIVYIILQKDVCTVGFSVSTQGVFRQSFLIKIMYCKYQRSKLNLGSVDSQIFYYTYYILYYYTHRHDTVAKTLNKLLFPWA